MNILITGAAGFIGAALAERLLRQEYLVTGIDNINSYYDTELKMARLRRLTGSSNFRFYEGDICGINGTLPSDYRPDIVIHLAAQAGVRFSLEQPGTYFHSNLLGFGEVLQLCREREPSLLVYASSSSVYGANRKVPYSVKDEVNHPISIYAATKRANELMAESYSSLFGLPAIGLRFFTVYGPWGRPDMAYFSFAQAMTQGRAIKIYGEGRLRRDFTYIDDIIAGITACLGGTLEPGRARGSGINESSSPHRILNLGNTDPRSVLDLVKALESSLGVKAIIDFAEKPAGDVQETWADISETTEWCGYRPTTSLEAGIDQFSRWFRDYYKVQP